MYILNNFPLLETEKAGFIYEGMLQKSSFEKGRFCDAAICSILREEYIRSYICE